MNLRHFHLVITLLLGLCTALFWALAHPEVLSFHEQNQLFLCTTGYLRQSLTVPGGLADWLAEALVQFFFYPVLGAVLLALLFMALQAACRALSPSSSFLSVVPALLVLFHMGDFDALLSYPVALVLTVGCFAVTAHSPLWLKAILTPALVWCAGPVGVLYPVLTLWKQPKQAIILTVLSLVSLFVSFRLLSAPRYPAFTLLWGINYHRLVLKVGTAPALQWVIPAVIALLPRLQLLGRRLSVAGRETAARLLPSADFLLAIGLILAATLPGPLTRHFYDPSTCAILEQSRLIRRGAWDELLDKAQRWQHEGLPACRSDEYCTAVNLSLAMTGRLDQHFADYPQTGFTGLLSPNHHDNISGMPTMEAFYRMGLISEAMHYAFDMQESIANYRKSARLTRRLSECNIILGHYKVADKYLSQLEQTMFYRSWARSARQSLASGTALQHEPWGTLSSYCLPDDAYFRPDHVAVVIRQLCLHNAGNRVARQYLQAYVRLLRQAQ